MRSLIMVSLISMGACALSGNASACAFFGQVYADACATDNSSISGKGFYVDPNGNLQESNSNNSGTTFTAAPSNTPGVPLSNVTGSVADALSGGGGASQASATATDKVYGSSTAIALSGANQTVSYREIKAKSVVPNLHISLAGVAVSPGGFSTNAASGASTYFGDLISISQAQLEYDNAIHGTTLNQIFVALTYSVSGSRSPNSDNVFGSYSSTQVNFTFSGYNVANSSGAYQLFDFGGDTDDKNINGTYTGILELTPGQLYQITASLSGGGTAVSSSGGGAANYNIDYSHSADFLGAEFFADAALTERLPDFDLNSQLGINYSSITLLSAVPEPSTWALMLVGFCGLGFVAHRRKKPVEIAA